MSYLFDTPLKKKGYSDSHLERQDLTKYVRQVYELITCYLAHNWRER